MSKREGDDPGLETLLEMDGEVFPMESGYWTKIEARRVDPSPQIPHGIREPLFHSFVSTVGPESV